MEKKIWSVRRIMILMLTLVLSFSLVGCKEDENQSKVVNGVNNEQEATKTESEKVIDENTGLVYEGKMELKYAENFAVKYYEGGYKIVTDASDRKVLIVPEGKQVPEMKEQLPIIQQPIDNFAVYSTIAPSWFRPIDEVDRIVAVTFEEDKWKVDDMAQRVKNGDATYVGSSRALDYELLQSINPSVNLLSKSSETDLFPKFDELELKYLSMGSYLEDDPRGRLEWTKFIAALLDKEDEAEKYFEEELARIDAVEKKITEHTQEKPKVTMAYFSSSKQAFRVTHIKGYKVENIEMAGGLYHPSDLGLEKRGSTGMTPEEFYKVMSETDILIYDSVSGHSIQSLDDILETADYLADTKVIKEGRVWGLKRDFWQVGEKVADMTEEYYNIFYTPHGEIEETKYFYLMK